MQFQDLKAGQIFTFNTKGKYSIEGIDSNTQRTINNKYFRVESANLGIIATELKTYLTKYEDTDYILQSFIHGKGFNKSLFYVDITIV